MNAKQRAIVEDYIQKAAKILRLQDWNIHLSHTPADNGENGRVQNLDGRKYATIYLASEFPEFKPEVQRHTIAHELVHLHFFSACDMVRADLVTQLSQNTYNVFWDGFVRQLEYGVDGVADAFTALLPDIEWGKIV